MDSRITRRSARVSMRQFAIKLTAKLTVAAPSWKRKRGGISIVPPARSTLVGADDSIITIGISSMNRSEMKERFYRRKRRCYNIESYFLAGSEDLTVSFSSRIGSRVR